VSAALDTTIVGAGGIAAEDLAATEEMSTDTVAVAMLPNPEGEPVASPVDEAPVSGSPEPSKAPAGTKTVLGHVPRPKPGPGLESTQILLESEQRGPRKLGWVILVSTAMLVAVAFMVFLPGSGNFLGLGSDSSDLAGTWFRIGDKAEGTAVEVSLVGEQYEARAALIAEHLRKFGFTEDDLMWREIERLDENRFRGKVLYKETEQPSGKVIKTFYREHDFFFEPPDTLRSRSLASGNEVMGTEQVWRRLKD